MRLFISLAGAAMLCAGLMAAPQALFAAPQFAQWYVGSAGNNTSGCGSQASPCQTISYLLPAAAPGDQIIILDFISDSFTLDKSVLILGANDAGIDGSGGQILEVNAGVSAALTNLTLRNGGGDQDGGLIYNAGTLVITNAVLTQGTLATDNGGAIYNAGALTIISSTLSNNTAQFGGGIENEGMLVITASTFTNNRADYGGGIDNFGNGAVHLYRSVIISNTAASGGGIYNNLDVNARLRITETAIVSNTAQNYAGGIYNGGQLSLVNTTVSNNHLNAGLGAAIDHQAGSLTMLLATVAGNTVASATGSSAVNFAATSSIGNSVITNAGLANCSGNATSNGYNFGSDASCVFFNQATDANNADARLGRLQFSQQAPGTYTQPPLSGSPLVNRIPPASCGGPDDQRGVARPQGAACDIGAHEVVPVDLSLVAQAMPASLPASTTLTVTLNITNAGPVIATGVVVTSNLPAGVGLKGCNEAASCVASAGRLTATLGTLNANANAVVVARLVPQQSGSISIGFTSGSDEWDTQTGDNTASINAAVVKSADVSVSLNGPSIVPINTAFTVTADLLNQSDYAVDGLSFTLALPASAEIVSASGASWDCAQAAGVVTCSSAQSLAPHQTANVVITLHSGNAPALLQFTGNASASTFDPDLSNNTAGMTLIADSGLRIALPIVLR